MAKVKPTKTGSGLLRESLPRRPHLVRGVGGIRGEVTALRDDVKTAMAPVAAVAVAEWTSPATGSELELPCKPVVRAGKRVILAEVVGGEVVYPPTGTLTDTAYIPSEGDGEDLPDNSPDGTKSYAVYYEYIP